MNRKSSIWSKIIKFILYTIFIVVFVVVALSIIFYASGYKFNWESKKIQKSGMIIISYEPDGISILIDGKPADFTKGKQGFWAPTDYVTSVLPGKYSIEIKKGGKKEYMEDIVVDEEKITKIANIILIPEKINEIKLFQNNIVQYSISPDGKKIISKNTMGDIFFDDTTKNTQVAMSDKLKNVNLNLCSWSQNNKYAILETATDKNASFYIFNTEENISSFFFQDAFSFVPDFSKILFPDTESNIVLGIAGGTIYKINITSKTMDKLADNIEDIYSKGSVFYFKKGEKNLYQFDPTFSLSNIILENFDRASDFDVFSINKNVYVENDKGIYLIKDKNNLNQIEKDVDELVNSQTKNGFFYNKGFELWFFDDGSQQDSMISRFSQKIKKAELFHNGYVLYTSEKELGLIRTDGTNNQSIQQEDYINSFKITDQQKVLLITKEKDGLIFKILDLELTA